MLAVCIHATIIESIEEVVRAMVHIPKLRPSPIAGLWYSDDRQELALQVDGFLQAAMLPQLSGEVVGVISPHAGYRYSGSTAGYAFRAVQGRQFDIVAVVSPLHDYFPGTFLTSAHEAYQTPLGALEIDRAALAAVDAGLRAQKQPGLNALSYDQEHALEIELPFLQRALDGPFRLLPLMLRSQDEEDAAALGSALAEALRGQKALLVASSDLSHFYPEPMARQLDAEMLRRVASLQPSSLFRAEREGKGYACGVAAVAAVLAAARELGATEVKILHQTTSAEASGDYHKVVGYGAAVALKPA